MVKISTETKIVCTICGGSGMEEIPTEYKKVWGRVIRNGEMECDNCNGRGYLRVIEQ